MRILLAESPIHWTAPATWPWFVYVWLAIVASSFIKSAWNKLHRSNDATWPATDGHITIAEVTERKTSFFASLAAKSQSPGHTAQLHYSYPAVGESYTGRYEQDFPTEAECQEFVRDLAGKTVTVQYNPNKPKNSFISTTGIESLLQTRAPRPENEPLVPFTPSVPEWLRPFVWLFVALSALGLLASLWVHFSAVMGRRVVPEQYFIILHMGIFVVWFPVVLVANRMVANTKQNDFWKIALRGASRWVRYLLYGLFGYAAVNFLFFITQASSKDFGNNPPVGVWRGFSGHWMVFYSVALVMLYSAARTVDMRLRCVNGHLVSYQAECCAQCGQPVLPPR